MTAVIWLYLCVDDWQHGAAVGRSQGSGTFVLAICCPPRYTVLCRAFRRNTRCNHDEQGGRSDGTWICCFSKAYGHED